MILNEYRGSQMESNTTSSSHKNVRFLNRRLFSIIPIMLGIASFFWPIFLPNLEDYVLEAGEFCVDRGSLEKTKDFCDNQRGVAKAISYIIFPFLFFISSNWVVLYLEEALVAYKEYKQRRNDRRAAKQLIDNFSTKVTENLDVHLRRLSDGHRLTEIGDAVESLKSIRFEMQNADMVRNTFVTFKDSDVYEDEAEAVYAEYFQNNRERHWEDLISYPEVFSQRFKMKLTDDVVGTRHHVRILRHNVPLINFMILYKNDEPISAYIGWIHAERARGPIFATRDKKLTRLLDRHFERLWKGKTFRGHDVGAIGTTISVDYSKPPGKRFAGIDLVRKFGKWVTLSFSIDDKGDIVQYSLGIICVDLKEGSISLRGQIRRGSNLMVEAGSGPKKVQHLGVFCRLTSCKLPTNCISTTA